jgi:hypothetical protein
MPWAGCSLVLPSLFVLHSATLIKVVCIVVILPVTSHISHLPLTTQPKLVVKFTSRLPPLHFTMSFLDISLREGLLCLLMFVAIIMTAYHKQTNKAQEQHSPWYYLNPFAWIVNMYASPVAPILQQNSIRTNYSAESVAP